MIHYLLSIRGGSLKVSEIRIIQSVLGDFIGRVWFVFLLSCWRKARSLFKNTKWDLESGPETRFVKRLALAAAMYRELTLKFGRETAFDIVQRIVVQIGFEEQSVNASQMRGTWDTEFSRLDAFHNLMDEKGGPRFNTRTFLQRDRNLCHFRVTRCVFYDFFSSIDVPELTKLFCEVDRVFFTTEFPSVKFHRNGSWENTIAFGKDFCEFIFEA